MTVWPDSSPQAPEDANAPAQRVALARAKFLSAEPVQPDEVRGTILASWRRSSDYHVDCDALATPYEEDLDVHGHLTQAAAPILDQLRNQLDDQAVSIVLTDAHGFVLDRRTGQHELQNYLDRVHLAPGFTYAEQFVGTNGIGTALEAREATLIHEQEHFTGPLVNLACAGVPIHDPITGNLEGILDITCFARDASPLLMAMALGAAQGVQAGLLHQSRGQDIALLQEYLRASRRSKDPILAVNDEVVMMNVKAQTALSAQDQIMLMEHLRENPIPRRSAPAEMDLPSGLRCRVYAKQIGSRSFNAVARIQFLDGCAMTPGGSESPFALPGVVGSSAMWRRCCRTVDRHYQDNCWVVLEGEGGTGKAALAQAVHRYRAPGRQIRILDALEPGNVATWRDALRTVRGAIVLRHLDRLSDSRLAAVEQHFSTASSDRHVWVAATVDSGADRNPLLERVLAYFPRSVEVPPLRHHIEDVEEIATVLLQQATKRANAHFSPAALRILMRGHWPGNIAELRQVIQSVASRTRSSTIMAEDLPPQCTSQNRRILTPIESMERDAIVQGLTEANGNRTKAARALGISRATIYRKIAEYGINA